MRRSFEIVSATAEDIPALAEYRFAMFAEMFPETDYSIVKSEFLEAARGYYASRLDGAGEVSLVARKEGRVIGCGSIMFQQRPPHVKNLQNLFGYILNIYVLPEFRKQGAATALMQALSAEGKKRGVKRIGLHASAAGAFVYRKLGYVPKPSYMELEI